MRATSSSRSSRPDAPPFPDASSIVSDRGEPASVLDVEAGDEALVDLENMPDGLIEQHFALKVSHDLVDLYRGRSVVPLRDVHGVDVKHYAAHCFVQ
jgi:hypothetical protein